MPFSSSSFTSVASLKRGGGWVKSCSCKSFCTLDPSKKFYTQCTYNGVTYLPITTRILPTDVYSCGDGVCQFTESCGTGGTYDNCFVDCGTC